MDWIINDELGLTVGHVVVGAAASFMIVGGVIPYVPQYRQIKETQDPEGFSLHVCLALLIANTLRILFWFSKRYEIPLLIQSVVMNVTMFLMIHLCVKVKRSNAIMRTRDRIFSADGTNDGGGSGGSGGKSSSTITTDNIEDAPNTINRQGNLKHYLSDFDIKYFWQWTDFQSYLDFMLVVWAIGAAMTYLMLSYEWFMEVLGFCAVFTEAMLGAPQFLRNLKNKSTHGMSILMVIMWTLGDLFKTCYFLARDAPTQFWICGTLQVTLDLAILLQVYIYRKNSMPKNNHRGD